MKKITFIVSLCLLVSGCATTGIRIVKKNTHLTEDSSKGSVFFKLDCGRMTFPVAYLWVMEGEVDTPKKKPLQLALHEKGIFNGNFRYDPTFFLLQMPAGTWHIVDVSDGMNESMAGAMAGLVGYCTYKLVNRTHCNIDVSFKVEPGKVSYLGTLKLYSALEVIDEQTDAFNAFKALYPDIQMPLETSLAIILDRNGNIVQSNTHEPVEKVPASASQTGPAGP